MKFGKIKWFIVLMLIISSNRINAYTIPYETWMGTYIGERKVGYLSFKIEKVDENGETGYRIASVLNNRLTVLGADLTQLVTTVVRTDENFVPQKEDFSMSSGGKITRVSAVFHPDRIECVVSAGSGSSTKCVPIPEGARLVGDAMFGLVDPSPKIGEEYRMHYFNPLTLSVEELRIKVDGFEKIKDNDREIDAVVVKNWTPLGEMTIWQDKEGDVIKVAAIMGITMKRQPREKAIAGIESSPTEDIAVLASVKPNKKIFSPRSVKRLSIILEGIYDPNMIISDSRQVAKESESDNGVVRYDIRAGDFDETKSIKIPVAQSDMLDYLMTTPYLDHDLRIIRETAAEIVQDETNAYKVCSKIRDWMYKNLKTRADIGIPRSASDVLKSRMGVCRDYAILFAALARNRGIPAKVVAGLTYVDGSFYYHAWVECFVGEWVPFDATLPTDFVDATHIKLAEGDATSMFGMAKVIGSLKAKIISYE